MHKPAQILLAFFLPSLFSFVRTRSHPARHHRGRKPRVSHSGPTIAPARKDSSRQRFCPAAFNFDNKFDGILFSFLFFFFQSKRLEPPRAASVFSISPSATLITVNARAARFDWRSRERRDAEWGLLSDRRRQISSEGKGMEPADRGARDSFHPSSIRPSNSSGPRFDSLIIGNRSPTAR